MTRVRDYRNGAQEGATAPVKVGDSVGFKSDHEQYGTITRIEGEMLHLYRKGGFSGDYLRYSETTVMWCGDCWIDY